MRPEPSFKKGDRIRLTAAAIAYYGGRGVWVPESQGGGTAGTIIDTRQLSYIPPPGCHSRPYLVEWDNGAFNSYRAGDLEAAE